MLNLNQLKKIYLNSPKWVQSIYSSIPYNIRNGSEYREWYNFLQNTIDVDGYQILKLKETVHNAYNNTLYYRKLFNSMHLSPNEINSLNDLNQLPLLTKKIINENYLDFQSQEVPNSKKFFVRTGGTTGHPTTFYQSENIWKKELAFVMDFFNRHNYYISDTKMSFKGAAFTEATSNKYCYFDPFSNCYYFSQLYLSRANIEQYVQLLNKYQPKFFHIYPSTLIYMIHLMQEAKLGLNYHLNVIFLVSEGYTKNDIIEIKNFFSCKIASFYGHSERIIFAPSINEDVSIFRNDKRYGLLELVDKNDLPVTETNLEGTIVGTSFDNYAMPLIRYKTDDTTSYLNTNNQTIKQITSLRTKAYIDAKNGEQISITFVSISSLSNNIESFQFYQPRIAELDLLIVPKNSFKTEEKEIILNEITKRIGHLMEHISVKIVNQPMRTQRGKSINIIKKYLME